jgi:acetylornithine deacetylase/succinyl-diaminopimelate desuccinylase-like protein
MLDILKQLVAFHTVDGNSDAAQRAFDYIAAFLETRGMFVERYTFDGYPALAATIKPHYKTPTVMLTAHVDVVPASNNMFELREGDGKLYGRGVFDMKFAVACYLQLVDDLKDELNRYDFGILLTCDEERGNTEGINGTKGMVAKGYLPRVCILPDGGDNWNIERLAKGAWHVAVTATGQAAHGSRPWEGESATETLMKALQEIRALFPEQQPYSNTLNISMIGGGEAVNQIPTEAWAVLDIRTMDHRSLALIKNDVQSICYKYNLSAQETTNIPPLVTDLENPFVHDFITSVETITGHECEPTVSFGASDGMYFNAHDIPVVQVRPAGGGHHGDHEWIDLQDFLYYKDVLIDYLKRVLNEPVGKVITTTPQEALTKTV